MLSVEVAMNDAGAKKLLDDMPKKLVRAIRRGEKKTANDTYRESIKQISDATNIPAGILSGLTSGRGKRVHKKAGQGKSLSDHLWFGFNPIRAKYLNPKQQGRGVSVAGKFYPGAVIAKKTGNVIRYLGDYNYGPQGGRFEEITVNVDAMERVVKGLQPKVAKDLEFNINLELAKALTELNK